MLSKPYTEAALAALLAQWLAPGNPPANHALLLDLSMLRARYPGNPELADELASLFVSTTETSLAALKRGIEQRDAEACRKEAHALKGAAASVMASSVQTGAASIEACVRRHDFAAAATELAALERHVRTHT